ncbi:MAG: RHH-type transcriptional regulator, proline utilization regulon repressor / proline dehydrogenase [Solirubrobacteraceae bacterium]|jgi:RHH-type proline utilization regulon transcriptional repressor/proline dehydrogenase/delta 1-pyrroline-5-carboxylate dehydrogenase|nr:RHH-type transcriptional regulator, proline utilization regulon repressor / proline dehydrogenase [Solirubrobacteraceae bacterium]
MTDLPPFVNEPIGELRRASVRDDLIAGLASLTPKLPLRVPVWIGDGERHGDELPSTDPGEPDRLVATAARATEAEVDEAVGAAARGFERWSAVPAARRAEILGRAAAWLRARRTELAALEVRECAKPWGEADADVCEAIDFLEFYARGAVALERGKPLFQVPGERNEMRYAPRGVVAVISPWNFPIAIPMGMVSAGLATGNAVVLKPAEQAPGCGLMVVRALREAGVPADAISLVPGEGEAGAALVRHPGVHTIAFTGSGPVGLEIMRAAAEPGARHLKRVVAEMGGKNCIVVDSDADLDDAVPAIVSSAFVYAGQKCSAASRVLVHEATADALLERVAGAVDVLVVGQADTFGTDVPPVIEREAQERVERYRALARDAGRIAVERAEAIPDRGWFVAPTVAADLPPDSPVLSEEIFGPLLTVERVRSVDAALERIDELPFALTGGLFCRNPHTVERVVRRTPVGNLYVNRPITGAMVGRQPFGGNRLSGTGTKAGGPDYLLAFVEPRVVSENTVRHGLVI